MKQEHRIKTLEARIASSRDSSFSKARLISFLETIEERVGDSETQDDKSVSIAERVARAFKRNDVIFAHGLLLKAAGGSGK